MAAGPVDNCDAGFANLTSARFQRLGFGGPIVLPEKTRVQLHGCGCFERLGALRCHGLPVELLGESGILAIAIRRKGRVDTEIDRGRPLLLPQLRHPGKGRAGLRTIRRNRQGSLEEVRCRGKVSLAVGVHSQIDQRGRHFGAFAQSHSFAVEGVCLGRLTKFGSEVAQFDQSNRIGSTLFAGILRE